MRAVASALVAFLAAAPLQASASPSGPCPDCGLREMQLDSKVLGELRVVRVRLPEGYQGGTGRYPVLYVLDGPEHLDHAAATAAYLARTGAMPRILVVSVWNVDRNRDFTPSRAGLGPQVMPTSGGADRFLRFLREELVPAVDGQFRTERFRILSGHSLGGLFALHVLATAPDAFDAYLAASPSAEWDNELVVKELARRLQGSSRLDRSLYVSLGDETEMLAGFESLRKTLRSASPPGFRWDSARFPGDAHGLVPLPTTIYGLRFTFDGFHPPLDPATGRYTGSPEELEAHYLALSARLGFDVLPPEGVVNLLGYKLLQDGKTGEALTVLRTNAQRYPGSPNAQDSLGEALEALGRMVEAAGAYERAVELGEAAGSPFLPEYRRHLRAVQRKLSQP
jgi:predicted alpha/beta superfamily hydrolase